MSPVHFNVNFSMFGRYLRELSCVAVGSIKETTIEESPSSIILLESILLESVGVEFGFANDSNIDWSKSGGSSFPFSN